MKPWRESRYFDFSEEHYPLPEREENCQIISFRASFCCRKNDQEIGKKFTKPCVGTI